MKQISKEKLFENISISNSFELLCFLRKQGFLSDSYQKELEYWWPGYGGFEVVIGVILTQNAAWKRVELALKQLREQKWLEASHDQLIEYIIACPLETLMEYIKPAGMFHKKAQTLKSITQAIKDTFGDFNCMQKECTREWLLKQKGIGPESADSILCYALKRDEMVADRYSDRLLRCLGYEFGSYDEVKTWLTHGIYENSHKLIEVYLNPVSFNYVFSRFHGKIDEFVKEYKI